MKAHKALEFENNYKEISENVLSSIEFLKCIRFEDGETWRWYPEYNGNIRGFRFYKVKVACDINRQAFMQCIYPCCIHYCKEIEWI